MKPIQMVDLTGQYASVGKEMDDAVLQAVRSGQYINGPEVQAFAKALSDYTGASYVIPCGNGTDALQMALMASDLKPGDEVIVPAFTYAAAVETVVLLGLTPVVTDVEAETCNMDVNKINEAISSKTKAIIPVHLFGQVADMENILKISSENKLFVIEDNAQSIGAEYFFSNETKKQAGTMGDIGTLSFFPTKNLGCYGDGGAMMTNHEDLAKRLTMISRHGQVTKYHHHLIGCNSRLDTVQAAVLLVKLKYLDRFTDSRKNAAVFYHEHLQELSEFIILPSEKTYSSHVYNQFTIRVKDGRRDELQSYLKERKIPATVYYPLPMHRQAAFRNIVRTGGDLSVSEELCDSVLSLPMHTELDYEQLEYIVEQIKLFFN
ncbi:MAG: DegT/DnrJ/EryC1/StrS family aminotransferase [Dysgonamonadaceae bacterium]|jgi:dTDP-4-amino-4,6-dideoxygalactose transaminase|nr:DegT/DnrJ/EryC1/StrS family aminotransferase [Dysgonamonadaceae bacterium]